MFGRLVNWVINIIIIFLMWDIIQSSNIFICLLLLMEGIRLKSIFGCMILKGNVWLWVLSLNLVWVRHNLIAFGWLRTIHRCILWEVTISGCGPSVSHRRLWRSPITEIYKGRFLPERFLNFSTCTWATANTFQCWPRAICCFLREMSWYRWALFLRNLWRRSKIRTTSRWSCKIHWTRSTRWNFSSTKRKIKKGYRIPKKQC